MVGGSRMSLLFVDVDVPSEIGLDGLLQNINNICATHGNVVFETVFADVFHQFLQVIYLCYSDATVHSVGIVGQFALAQIGFDAALGIVGGKSEKGEVALRHFRIDRTKGVDLAQGASEHTERTEPELVVADKRAWEVTAVGTYTLIAVVGKIVVPVEQGRSLS